MRKLIILLTLIGTICSFTALAEVVHISNISTLRQVMKYDYNNGIDSPIILDKGTYNISKPLVVYPGITLEGTVKDGVLKTIINAQYKCPCIFLDYGNLQSLDLQEGMGVNGGGIDVAESDVARDWPSTISHCIISGCVAANGAGIFAVTASDPSDSSLRCTIKDDVITDCLSNIGGGICMTNTKGKLGKNQIIDCDVEKCVAGYQGGGIFGNGIYVVGDTNNVKLTGQIISALPAGYYKAKKSTGTFDFTGMELYENGCYNNGGAGCFHNCSLYGKIDVTNNKAKDGGGLELINSSVDNNIKVDGKEIPLTCNIADNVAGMAGGGIYQINGSLNGCNIHNNTVIHKYYTQDQSGNKHGYVAFGGGLYYTSSVKPIYGKPCITNCTISNNSAFSKNKPPYQNIYVGYQHSNEKSYFDTTTLTSAKFMDFGFLNNSQPLIFMKKYDDTGTIWAPEKTMLLQVGGVIILPIVFGLATEGAISIVANCIAKNVTVEGEAATNLVDNGAEDINNEAEPIPPTEEMVEQEQNIVQDAAIMEAPAADASVEANPADKANVQLKNANTLFTSMKKSYLSQIEKFDKISQIYRQDWQEIIASECFDDNISALQWRKLEGMIFTLKDGPFPDAPPYIE